MHFNTTLVKVHLRIYQIGRMLWENFNTTLVKVHPADSVRKIAERFYFSIEIFVLHLTIQKYSGEVQKFQYNPC